jgi:glycine/D-amino acid oxidase-like deaminating enzyme
VLLEADAVAEGASGRNGGFADPSLTHGLHNGLHHFPREIQALEKLGLENYAGYVAALERYGIDARIEENGVLAVATEAYQVDDLREYFEHLQRFGYEAEWLDRDGVQREVASPTYHAGIWRHSGSVVDPARVAWGLRDAALQLGVRIYEGTRVEDLAANGKGIEARTPAGSVRADKAVSASQLGSLGWQRRQGIGDSGNRFHYYRLTMDNRILWGGYDAIYPFGSRIRTEDRQRRASFVGLSERFFRTFPQLEGLRFTHTWGGPIATTTRFCMDVGAAYGRRVSWATGYTGLGVVASRFGARVALDLLDRPEAPHLALRFVRRRPFPWPPEPFRALAVELTQRGLAKADRNEGRRGPWLRLLDRLGLGFDS